jgi:hypothetical protein
MDLKRVFGLLLVITAATALIFSVVGLFEIWSYRPGVTQTVNDTLASMDQALTTTQDGLTVVSQVVQTTTADAASLQRVIEALAQTIHDTNPMLDSLSNLTSQDFPAAIDATQTSLASAQGSALLIDNVLTAITSLPLLPTSAYKPDVPLHTALAQVSTSLNSLKPALVTINTSLVDGKTSLGVVEGELAKMSDTLKGIGVTLGSAQTIISQYQTTTAQLKQRVEATQVVASGWITTITWILTFLLVWLLIAQLGLGAQGLDLLRARPLAKEDSGLVEPVRANTES